MAAAGTVRATSIDLRGVNFCAGADSLDPADCAGEPVPGESAHEILDDALEMFDRYRPIVLEISGHTSAGECAGYDACRALGLARARSVRDYLVANGLDADRITAVTSFADERPLEPMDSMLNRRVELNFTMAYTRAGAALDIAMDRLLEAAPSARGTSGCIAARCPVRVEEFSDGFQVAFDVAGAPAKFTVWRDDIRDVGPRAADNDRDRRWRVLKAAYDALESELRGRGTRPSAWEYRITYEEKADAVRVTFVPRTFDDPTAPGARSPAYRFELSPDGSRVRAY